MRMRWTPQGRPVAPATHGQDAASLEPANNACVIPNVGCGKPSEIFIRLEMLLAPRLVVVHQNHQEPQNRLHKV